MLDKNLPNPDNIFTKKKAKRSKAFWFFWIAGMLLLITGMVLVLIDLISSLTFANPNTQNSYSLIGAMFEGAGLLCVFFCIAINISTEKQKKQ